MATLSFCPSCGAMLTRFENPGREVCLRPHSVFDVIRDTGQTDPRPLVLTGRQLREGFGGMVVADVSDLYPAHSPG